MNDAFTRWLFQRGLNDIAKTLLFTDDVYELSECSFFHFYPVRMRTRLIWCGLYSRLKSDRNEKIMASYSQCRRRTFYGPQCVCVCMRWDCSHLHAISLQLLRAVVAAVKSVSGVLLLELATCSCCAGPAPLPRHSWLIIWLSHAIGHWWSRLVGQRMSLK